MADKFELNGYLFLNKIDFDKARKEQEAIDYICSNSDLTNILLVKKMYNKLLEKGTFRTIIGYEFLKGLQNTLREDGEIVKKEINLIPVRFMDEKQEVKNFDTSEAEKKVKKYQELYEKERAGKISLKIIIGFLTVIIIGILIVSRLTPYTIFTNYEEKIVSQYVEWQTELEEREAHLNQWEGQLEEREKIIKK